MKILRWLNPMVWWRRHQRHIDVLILGPVIKQKANGDDAIWAFCWATHFGMDPAWGLAARWEFTPSELQHMEEVVKKLPLGSYGYDVPTNEGASDGIR